MSAAQEGSFYAVMGAPEGDRRLRGVRITRHNRAAFRI